MKRFLCIIAGLLVFCGAGFSQTQVTELKVTTCTLNTYYIGKTAVEIPISYVDKELILHSAASNSLNIHWGYTQYISTRTPEGAGIGYDITESSETDIIEPDGWLTLRMPEKSIYVVNEALSVSSSTLKIHRRIYGGQ